MIDSSQHTSTITCTAAPRVWHFSVFHCLVDHYDCLGAHYDCLGVHYDCLGAHYNCLGAHYICLGAHYICLGAHYICLGAHYDCLGIIMIIWICQEIHFLSLSMLSLQFIISVKGVTTIFYFSPEGHIDFLFCLVSH